MFGMIGRTVCVYRYKTTYTRDEIQMVEYSKTIQEAQEIASIWGGQVSELPIENDAWMDGIEVSDTKEPYAEALRILDIGKEAYEKEKQDAADKDSLTWDVLASAIKEGVVQVD